MVSWHSSCKTATLPVDNPSGCRVLSWRSWRNPATWGPGTSCTYGWTIAPSIWGGMNFVSPLKAMGLRISLRRKALASSLLRSPPDVCLWSPHQTTRPLRGTLAMAKDSSKFPYCWPSSLRATSTSDIHRATGLYGCVHSWWKPPPQPMITCLVRKTVLRNPGRTSSFVLLAGPFSSSVTPTSLPNFSSSEGGRWRDSMCLAKACAAAFSLVTTMTFSVGSITNNPAIMAAAARVFPAPKTPLMGQSVRPSKMDWTNTVSTAKKWQSGFVTNGRMAWNRAPSARRANWSNFTEAANNDPRSPGKMGVNFSSARSPHPRHSLSGAMLVKTASSSALLVSPRNTISTMKMFAWKARPCSPMCASWKARYRQSPRLRRASLQKAHAMLGGSHANSVSDGTTRFHSLFSVFFPRFATDSCAK